MKLSDLLASRKTINQQATLANLAYAYLTLNRFAERISGARLRGPVRLRRVSNPEDGFEATLTALAGNQSVLEEHFTEGDVVELAEAIFFAADIAGPNVVFRIEDFAERFLGPLRATFEEAGVAIDVDAADDGSPGV